MVPSENVGAVVHGALFKIPRSEKGNLDRVEGLGHGYQEVVISTSTPGGNRSALTYVADTSHINDSLLPYTWYRDLAAEGAASLGISSPYVLSIRNADARPDPDRERDR